MTVNLSDQEYLRERSEPRPGDLFYLHLSDLFMAMKELVPVNADRVLDYGCGGSPYRNLFQAHTYHRADLAGGDGLDFQYGEDGRLPVNSSEYDCVLSSQVLEHVLSPTDYLGECYRVLKPGGTLILSTHGLFEDHSCPADYWRWTAAGLQKSVEAAGFEVGTVRKLTTGARAAVFFAERARWGPEFRRAGLFRYGALAGLAVLQRVSARRRHQACDTCFPRDRVVEANAAGHDTYVAIALAARR
jgi:SAM-dependent methyltransferase